MTYFFLLLGFILLIKGADYFVEGASKLARLLRVSPLLIGLTIVAFGTRAPEATVSFIAALAGSSDVAIGTCHGIDLTGAFRSSLEIVRSRLSKGYISIIQDKGLCLEI